tara:strand:- start:573 stop:1124 length:552 start_codon:yes stop_codon:yes gene_type:complete
LLLQCPFSALAILLVWCKLRAKTPLVNSEEEDKETLTQKLRRIDFFGAALMMTTILSLLLAVEIGVGKRSILDPFLLGLIVMTLCTGTLFCFVENYWAKEPIFPLHLFGCRAVWTSYSILAIQNALQLTVSVPNVKDISLLLMKHPSLRQRFHCTIKLYKECLLELLGHIFCPQLLETPSVVS